MRRSLESCATVRLESWAIVTSRVVPYHAQVRATALSSSRTGEGCLLVSHHRYRGIRAPGNPFIRPDRPVMVSDLALFGLTYGANVPSGGRCPESMDPRTAHLCLIIPVLFRQSRMDLRQRANGTFRVPQPARSVVPACMFCSVTIISSAGPPFLASERHCTTNHGPVRRLLNLPWRQPCDPPKSVHILAIISPYLCA
jgi:hypothetical protein